MSSYQARPQGGPNGQAQFGQYNNQYHNHPQPNAQQVYEQQFIQQQQQQAYLQQLQLQQQLLMQQQLAIQQQAAIRAALAGGHNQFQSHQFQQQQQQHAQYSGQVNQQQYRQPQQRQQQRQQYQPAQRSVSASRVAEHDQTQRANPLVASALARQAKRQSLNLDQTQPRLPGGVDQARSRHSSANARPPQASRTDSTGSTHHRRSSSGHSSNKSGSPEPPALILSRPGDPFPDTSGSETSSDGGLEGEINLLAEDDDNEARDRRDKLAASFAGLSVRAPSPAGRASQASSLAAALAGRSNRQRPASLGLGLGLGQPPDQAPHSYHRSVSDSTNNLSAFAASFVPLPPSPFPGQVFSPPTPHAAQFAPSANPNNALSRGKAPVKGGAAALRQPKGPVAGAESNFAARLRRAAVAQLACVDRVVRVV